MKIDAIKLNSANPRQIKDASFKKLCKSVKEFPKMLALRPIVVDRDGTILGGNMRYRALLSLGYKEIPDEWVRYADTLTDEEKRRFIIEDNVEFGEWDIEALANEWDTGDLSDWGVGVPDLERSALQEAEEDDFNEEEVTESVCRKGDVWQLGDHRLMCGDSTSKEDFAKLMGEERADMVFTDPPYGVSIGDKKKLLKEKVSKGKGNAITDNIKNDTLGTDELYDILVKAMTNVREFSKDDASYYVTSPQGGELGLMMMMMKNAGLPVRHMLIWCKNSATFSLGRLDYEYQHEPIFYTWTKSHHNYRGGENRTTIWKYDKPRSCDLHPTMKPVELVANCIKDTTKERDIVLDAFGGSGTTMIAAEQLNRKCRMMELDPHYCDVIIARWEKLTEKEAVKISKP